jgi:hypothetical protein
MEMKKKKKELISHLQNLAGQLGRTPTSTDIIRAGTPSLSAYRFCFGGIKKALAAAGLKRSISRKKYTKEELITHLQELAKKLGRTPTSTDISKAGGPALYTFSLRFGGIPKALEAAGFKAVSRYQVYTRAELVTHLQVLAKKLGRTPYSRDIERAGTPVLYTYSSRFGSIPKARKAAGLEAATYPKKYTYKELITYLKMLAKQLGRTPTRKDFKQAGEITYSAYYWYFGSIAKAYTAAGLPEPVWLRGRYTNKELIKHLKTLAKKLGRTPAIKDINEAGKPGYSIYMSRFGSIKKAQAAAGLIH